jgi:two-component system CheB/CheR fusion protein
MPFERPPQESNLNQSPVTSAAARAPAPLDAILCTEDLQRRPSRPPDWQTENRALLSLVHALAESPRTILQSLVETILEVTNADSGGVSLLSKDETRFHWPAIAGVWKQYIGGGTPRDFGPCGDVLDCGRPLLFRNVESRYAYFEPVQPRVAECLLVPFFLRGKAVGTIWAVFHDPSERRFDREDLRILESLSRFASAAVLAQESLDSSARLAAIVDSSDDAVISKDLNGVIQSWNASAQRLFGYTAKEAVGRHISLLIPPERLDEEDEIIARLRAGERVRHFDTVRVRSDGTPIHVSLTISPVRDDAGRIVGASKIARDITDAKEAELRTYDLLTRLQEADRRKDEFLAMLAHELRNPLAPLRNTLEIMKREKSDGDLIAQVRSTLERQLAQLVRLVDDLMDVSRITRGNLDIRKERIELASVIQQSVEVSRPLADRARHALNVSLPPEPILLFADPARMTQVFGNLLTNACKYSEPGARISLSVERQGSDVVVAVKDSGVGIAPDKIDGVFDMFTQIDQTLERSQGGLGVGLTLVKRLVELHGGSVSAHSEGLGRGSEFVVRLPVLLEKAKAESTTIVDDQPAAAPHRVLIVDDNRDAAASLAMLLDLSGNETETAHDGIEAYETAERFRPDVMLLDIGLPKVNGYEVCRRIREQPWGRRMLLIALTGWGQEEDRRQSKDAGFDHHMVKPLDLAELAKLLAD